MDWDPLVQDLTENVAQAGDYYLQDHTVQYICSIVADSAGITFFSPSVSVGIVVAF